MLPPNLNAEFVRRILDEIPAAIFCKDVSASFRFVYWNKYAERIWGLKNADVVGKTDYDLFTREHADFFRAKDVETMRANHTVLIQEEEIDSPGGHYWLRTRKVPLTLADGQQFLLGISEDITEERGLKAELERERKGAERSQQMAALGELAGGVAHQINSPLSALIIQMEILDEQTRDESLPLDRGYLRSAITTVQRTSARIIEVTKTLSTYASYTRRNKPQVMQLQKVVQDALAFHREKLRLSGVECRLGELSGDFEIKARPMELLQALMKLIEQAATAAAGEEEKWLSISTKMTGHEVELSIRHSGSREVSREEAELYESVMHSHGGRVLKAPDGLHVFRLPLG